MIVSVLRTIPLEHSQIFDTFSMSTGSAIFYQRPCPISVFSTRLAPVRFMFNDRKGSVKVVASKEHENHESHLEALIETALNNGAEDLEEISTDTEVEMQVWSTGLLC